MALFVNEILTVRPGSALDFLAAVVEERAPLMPEYGHEPTGIYEVLSNQHEVVVVWATDIPSQVRLYENRGWPAACTTTAIPTSGSLHWERRSAEFVIGGAGDDAAATVYGPDDWEDASLDDWLASVSEPGSGE